MTERSELHAMAVQLDALIRELSVAVPAYLSAVNQRRRNRPVIMGGRSSYRRTDPDNELDLARSRVFAALEAAARGHESDLARWHSDAHRRR